MLRRGDAGISSLEQKGEKKGGLTLVVNNHMF